MIRTLLLSTVAAVALVGTASAADLPSRKAPEAYAPVAYAYSWTGAYIGVDGGYSWIQEKTKYPNGGPANAPATLKADTFVLGGHVGYRQQFGNLVAGVELNAESLFGKKDHALPVGFPVGNEAAVRADWSGSIRGSLGYAFDRSLLYVTGGAAYLSGRGFTFIAIPVVQANSQFNINRWGWTLGAGYAYALTNNWVLNAEYRYANFGTKTYTTPLALGATQNTKIDTHTVLLGLSYKFGGPSAVVAKY